MKQALPRNIKLFYLYKICSSMFFFVPVMVLFWQDNGLSLTQIMILQSLFSIATVLLEVPSGYFADVQGRKKTLAISSITGTAAVLIYSVGSNFYHFLLAEMFFALSVSFSSGTASALVYDTLLSRGRENEYKQIWGSAYFYGTIALALANVLGGVAGKVNLRYAVFLCVPFFALSLPVVLFMREPERHKPVLGRGYFRDLADTLLHRVIRNRELRGIILYSGAIYAFNQAVLWLYQPYFELSGLDLVYFGLVFASFQAVAAFSGRSAHRLEKRLGERRSLIFLLLFITASYILMGSFIFIFSFVFCYLQQFVRGFKNAVVTGYINDKAPSDTRATILSAESFTGRLIYASVIPFFGYAADIYSLRQTLFIMGGTTFFIGGVILLYMLRAPQYQRRAE